MSYTQLTFNGTIVTGVNNQKHLGLILDSTLSFDIHRNEKIIKAKTNVGMLKHLSKFLPLKTLDQMYKALVRPNLDYCDIIYHKPPHLTPSPLGESLNSQMESRKKEPLQFLVLGAVSAVQNFTRN